MKQEQKQNEEPGRSGVVQSVHTGWVPASTGFQHVKSHELGESRDPRSSTSTLVTQHGGVPSLCPDLNERTRQALLQGLVKTVHTTDYIEHTVFNEWHKTILRPV